MKIRHLYLAVFGLLCLQSQAQADGLPYIMSEAGERVMHGDFIALTISEAQTTEISKSGIISFTGDQLKKLRAFYPEFPDVAGVASSTFNDNLERFESVADVIWWYADEVRVPLNPSAKSEQGMPSSEPWSSIDVLARIAPDGIPYHNGKETSYRDILAAIDGLAAKASANPSERPSVCVIVPPPHRGWAESNPKVLKQLRMNNADLDPNKLISRIYEFLETYAHAKGIGLSKCW